MEAKKIQNAQIIQCKAYVLKGWVQNVWNVWDVLEREHAFYPEFRLRVEHWISNVYGILKHHAKWSNNFPLKNC